MIKNQECTSCPVPDLHNQRIKGFSSFKEQLPADTYERLESYFSSLALIKVEPRVIGLIGKAFSLFIEYNILIGKPHLVRELFQPTIDPQRERVSRNQEPFLSAIGFPLTKLYAMLRDFRNEYWRDEILFRIKNATEKAEGSFTVSSGVMFSGKSNLLVQLIDALAEKKLHIYVPPSIGESVIIAREPRREIKARRASLEQLLKDKTLKGDVRNKVILFDETVFFPTLSGKPGEVLKGETHEAALHRRCRKFIEFLKNLRDRGAHVIVAALKSDVTSQEFTFYQYLREAATEIVVDEHTLITKLPQYQEMDFEDVLSMDPIQRIAAMTDIRWRSANRKTIEANKGEKEIIIYEGAASYAYITHEGKRVIAPATETTRVANHLTIGEDGMDPGVVDMLWKVFMPSRADIGNKNLPEAQREGSQMLRYFSRPEHCALWAFLKKNHPKLYNELRTHIADESNQSAFNNLLKILRKET